jgi:hypothetical protein
VSGATRTAAVGGFMVSVRLDNPFGLGGMACLLNT